MKFSQMKYERPNIDAVKKQKCKEIETGFEFNSDFFC